MINIGMLPAGEWIGQHFATTGLTRPREGAKAVTAARTGASASRRSWEVTADADQRIPGTDSSFNTPSLDGCPFISRDGKTFYMASDRGGGLGGIDIWVSTRASIADTWGPPVNVGEPVNSSSNDFCPTIDRDGHRFFFVSNRPGGCGGDDIYVTRLRAEGGFDPVTNVGCDTDGGANSAANEASPFPLPETGVGPVLYFSSTRSGGLGAQDIYSATRASTAGPWSAPVNLGSDVNSAAGETRPSLSWDGITLYFGSTRTGGTAEGSSDIYFTNRG